MRRIGHILGSVVLAFGLIHACANTLTNFNEKWVNEEYANRSIRKVLVVGVFDLVSYRGTFEGAVVEALKKEKIEATSSLSVLPPDEEISEAAFGKYFGDQDIDAVVIGTFVDEERRLRWREEIPNRGGRVGVGWYGAYHNSWNWVNSQGYMTQESDLYIETDVYDARDSEVIWSGVSQTLDAENAADAAASLARRLVIELKSAELLAK
jgi:hypothetical protein